jgi:hypothetical protein
MKNGPLKIYFCASISGGREDALLYKELIDYLKPRGIVFTEKIGDGDILLQETLLSPGQIHDTDVKWLADADVVVAEVSTPSLGVGYEIGRAVEREKQVLCLHRNGAPRKLSAMIAGCDKVTIARYDNIEGAKEAVRIFFALL